MYYTKDSITPISLINIKIQSLAMLMLIGCQSSNIANSFSTITFTVYYNYSLEWFIIASCSIVRLQQQKLLINTRISNSPICSTIN